MIALAVIAQFVQNAPATLPTSMKSVDLAPGVQLEIAFPNEVQPSLREADRVPIAITLRGSDTITYIVALSTSAPLLFTNSARQATDPRVDLAVDGCCQASALLYPQAAGGGWWWNQIGIDVYVAQPGAVMPVMPVTEFTVGVESWWKTVGRRILLLFAELGLAVSVALAFIGWAFEQGKRRQEQQSQVWQARFSHAQKVCEHDLLEGVNQLLRLRKPIKHEDDKLQELYEIEIRKILEDLRTETQRPYSQRVEDCLRLVAARLQNHKELTHDELNALSWLFDDGVDESGTSVTQTLAQLSKRNSDTEPTALLEAARCLFRRFQHSSAIQNLVIVIIKEWSQRTSALRAEETTKQLSEFRYIMYDPRLAHIPFQLRHQLYPMPRLQPCHYGWVEQRRSAQIEDYLSKLIPERVSQSPFSVRWIDNSDDPRLVTIEYHEPHMLLYSDTADVEPAARLLSGTLLQKMQESLRQLDESKSLSTDRQIHIASAITSHDGEFVPFVIHVGLSFSSRDTSFVEVEFLKQCATALGQRWIELLAARPQLWIGLPEPQKRVLAELLSSIARSESELVLRFLELRDTSQQDFGNPFSDMTSQQSSLVFWSLQDIAHDIIRNQHKDLQTSEVDASKLEGWLMVRPPHLTHTVMTVFVSQTFTSSVTNHLFERLTSLFRKLQANHVIVHFLIKSTFDQCRTSINVQDCRLPRERLAGFLDYAFVVPRSPDDRCKFNLLSRLLDNNSQPLCQEIADALLYAADGSPSRLLQILYEVLIDRLEQTEADDLALDHERVMAITEKFRLMFQEK